MSDVSRRVLTVAASLLASLVVLLACAGRSTWLAAWLYAAISAGVALVGLAVVPRDVIAERGRKKDDVEPWDRVLTSLITLPWLAQYVVAGLDQRFGWTPAPPTLVMLAGLLGYALGQGLVTAAMRANRYFSNVVRIQADRGQQVCDRGPYRVVRHPGYVGMMVSFLSTPLALGSWWSLLPALLVVALLVVRTALEDQTLRARLEGYEAYAHRVRWRLLPGAW